MGPYLRDEAGKTRRLYCSEISASFVLSQFEDIEPRMVTEVALNTPLVIPVQTPHSEHYSLRVTAVCANHCPGSVMFMFEKLDREENVETRILYTGAFRFDDGRPLQSRLSALHDSDGTPLFLDALYLDTTFMNSNYQNFCSRKDAEKEIWELVKSWVGKNESRPRGRSSGRKYVVQLHLPARYGYENILKAIYTRSGLRWRVHVPSLKFSTYLCHAHLTDCTDESAAEAEFVHACVRAGPGIEKCGNYLPCMKEAKNLAVLHIKPSAMFFNNEKVSGGWCHHVAGAGGGAKLSRSRGAECARYRVCYSTHSSRAELETFLRHLAPARVVPCVEPADADKRREMLGLLDSIMASLPSRRSEEEETSSEEIGDSRDVEVEKTKRKRRIVDIEIEEECNKTPKRSISNESLHLLLEESPEKLEKSPENNEEMDDEVNLDDTPDIEEVIENHANDPRCLVPLRHGDTAMKAMLEYKRRKDEIIVID